MREFGATKIRFPGLLTPASAWHDGLLKSNVQPPARESAEPAAYLLTPSDSSEERMSFCMLSGDGLPIVSFAVFGPDRMSTNRRQPAKGRSIRAKSMARMHVAYIGFMIFETGGVKKILRGFGWQRVS